mgnify:CR=1 FL=1
MKNKLIIFGAGKISEVVSNYFNNDNTYQICAYVVDNEFKSSTSFLGKPLVSENNIIENYPPSEYNCFIAVGYQMNNSFRRNKYEYFKKLGYSFANYISSDIYVDIEVGENIFIMDHAIVQPKVKVGSNVFIWGGAMVGHHSVLEDNCWVTGGSLIGGSSKIGNSCFLGMGSVIGHEVSIGKNSFIGASTLTTKNLNENSVVVKQDNQIHRLNTSQFIKISKLF